MTLNADENPIRRLLGAAGVPWQSSRAALAERYGIGPDPAYGWDIIAIAIAPPIMTGLLSPLSVQVFPQFSPRTPATDFFGTASVGDDARENLGIR